VRGVDEVKLEVSVTAIGGFLSPEKKSRAEEILGRLLMMILDDLDLANVLDESPVKDDEGEAEAGMNGGLCKATDGDGKSVSRFVVWEGILAQIPRLLAGRNEDYDDSYTRSRAEDGPMSLVVILRHKFNRLRNMALRKERLPVNASYWDTLRDIIGYCVLEMEYLGNEREAEYLQNEADNALMVEPGCSSRS